MSGDESWAENEKGPSYFANYSIWDSTILLTSRAIGTGFLFFPSHQEYGNFIMSKVQYE